MNQDRPEIGLDARDHLVVPFAALQGLQNRIARGHHNPKLSSKQEFEPVKGTEVLWVRHSNREYSLTLLDRHKAVLMHPFLRDRAERVRIHPEVGQRVVGEAVQVSEGFSECLVWK